MAAACVGGVTSGFNLGPSLANRAFGGRTRVSVLVNAGVTLVTLLALLPLVGYLPRAALSGTIIVIAIQAIDPWTKQTIRQLVTRDVLDWKRASIDLAVSLLVLVLAVVADIVVAVMAGLVIAIGFFLVRMSRSIVRPQPPRRDAALAARARSPLDGAPRGARRGHRDRRARRCDVLRNRRAARGPRGQGARAADHGADPRFPARDGSGHHGCPHPDAARRARVAEGSAPRALQPLGTCAESDGRCSTWA
jgi:hypothetical protein